MPEYVQIRDEPAGETISQDEVSDTKVKFQQMQAQMDAAVAQADAKRAEQQSQYENNINKGDPAAQL